MVELVGHRPEMRRLRPQLVPLADGESFPLRVASGGEHGPRLLEREAGSAAQCHHGQRREDVAAELPAQALALGTDDDPLVLVVAERRRSQPRARRHLADVEQIVPFGH